MIQITYLTTEDLKEITPISKNVDISQLESFIPVTESMHIIPILGLALDNQLKTEIENNTLSGNNLTLVGHIQNASAWLCFYEASIFLRTKAMNKGVVQQYSENSQVSAYDDFNQYRQGILDKGTFYLNYLNKYLVDNSSLYPLWRSNNECGNPNLSNSSGIYL